jgi:peptide/nickel transport system permease protein
VTETDRWSIKSLLKEMIKDPLASFSLIVILITIFLALFGQFITPYNPYAMPFERLQPPSWTHIFGTDEFGRDFFSRMIVGTKDVLFIGIVGSLGSAIIGVLVGAFSAYYSKYADYVLMRISDVLMIIPSFFLYLLIVSALMIRTIGLMVLMFTLTTWPRIARVVRSEVLSLKEREFVRAAKALGASNLRIIFRHILPNCMGNVIVLTTLAVSTLILTAAGLDFLGFGDPTSVSWGTLLTKEREFLRVAPLLTIIPGLAVFFVALSFNLIGDALRDVLDPRLKGVSRRKKK